MMNNKNFVVSDQDGNYIYYADTYSEALEYIKKHNDESFAIGKFLIAENSYTFDI